MILGKNYSKKMNEEIFLRTMPAGTFPLKEVRKDYDFISEKSFIKMISHLYYLEIIDLNKETKEITFSCKYRQMIDFIENTDFINNILKITIENYKAFIPDGILHYLEQTDFDTRIKETYDTKKEKYFINYSNELNLCLRNLYGKDFTKEILICGFFLNLGDDKNE